MILDRWQGREAIESQAERIERQRAYLDQLLEALGAMGMREVRRLRGSMVLIGKGKILEAWELLKEENPFPAVCGRVCPQESQCESQSGI